MTCDLQYPIRREKKVLLLPAPKPSKLIDLGDGCFVESRMPELTLTPNLLRKYEIVYSFKGTTKRMITRVVTDDIKNVFGNPNVEIRKVFCISKNREKFLNNMHVKFEVF